MTFSLDFSLMRVPKTLAPAVRRKQGSELLAQLLSKQVDSDIRTEQILRNALGQPYINKASWFLSLSHSGEYLSALVASVPCGIDIEIIKPHRDVEAIWQEIRHPKEPLVVTSSSDFYQWWCRKEAAWKVFACQHPDSMNKLAVVVDDGLYRGLTCRDIIAPQGYMMSIAYHA